MIDTEDGDRWAWSMVPGELYGTTGGWIKKDFIREWNHREDIRAPKRVEFEFNEETFSLEKKGRKKKAG